MLPGHCHDIEPESTHLLVVAANYIDYSIKEMAAMARWTRWLPLIVSLACSGQSVDKPPYLNPDLSAEKRAADLVSRMTLEEKVLQMQNSAPALPRLGIPAYDWWNEALHGVARAGEATVFPQAIGLAATFDTALMNRIATT